MPLHVEAITVYDPPVSGVAILVPGRSEPFFGVPFAKTRSLHSLGLDDQRVLLIGKWRNQQVDSVLLSVFDTRRMAFSEPRSIRTSGDRFQLSGDCKRLFIYGYGIAVVDLETFDIITNSNQIHVRDGRARLANARDFAEIVSGELVFHSRLLERAFKDPALRKIGLVLDALKDHDGNQLSGLLAQQGLGSRSSVQMIVDMDYITGDVSICNFAETPDEYEAKAGEFMRAQPKSAPRLEATPAQRAAFQAYAESLSDTQIAVLDWSVDACGAAVSSQAHMIATRFESLVKSVPGVQRSLRFCYRVGGEHVNEPSFFQRVVDTALPIRGELRALMLAYLDKIGPQEQQIYYRGEAGIPAMSFAMRALAVLDATSVDVIQRFMTALDLDHQSYCWEHIVGTFSALHGWSNRAAIEVGITLMMIDHIFCSHQQRVAGSVFAAASGMLMIEACARVAEKRATFLEKLYDTDQFDKGVYLARFAARLDRSNLYQASVFLITQVSPPKSAKM